MVNTTVSAVYCDNVQCSYYTVPRILLTFTSNTRNIDTIRMHVQCAFENGKVYFIVSLI